MTGYAAYEVSTVMEAVFTRHSAKRAWSVCIHAANVFPLVLVEVFGPFLYDNIGRQWNC